MILGSCSVTDEQLAELFHERLVTINGRAADASTVLIDTATAMKAAVAHLASLGHQSVTYVSGPENSWSNEQRWLAIEQATQETGMRADTDGPFPADKLSGAAAADQALANSTTSIIAFNDVLAMACSSDSVNAECPSRAT